MRKRIIYFVISLFCLCGYSYAGDIDLERIVVTPYRYEEDLGKVASSVTVITPKEIKSSNAQRAVDLLRQIPGVLVRDSYGNGKQVVVDIRGFGEQAGYNVLVLVDGRRLNDVDLSGVDWSQIPVDQVERIEVIRGGAGGVLYGDNASSGVINVITKKGSGKLKVNSKVKYGSYNMNAQKFSVEGGINEKFSYWLNAGRQSTDGYRANGFDKANDFGSKLDYKLSDALSLHFNSGVNSSFYGLPGALFDTHLSGYGRRYSRFGDDHVNNNDKYFVLGAKNDSDLAGKLDFDFNYRRKKTDSYFLTSYMTMPSFGGVKKNMIKTFGLTPKYTLGKSIFDHENKFIVGLDYYRSNFNSTNYAMNNNSLLDTTGITKRSIAGYLQNEFSIFKELVLVGGYRYDAVRYSFGYHDLTGYSPDQNTDTTQKAELFNSGLSYNYKEDSSAFLNIGKTFRFPEVDEFGFYDDFGRQQLDTNLKPQSAINYQAGIRHKFSDKVKASFSLYRMVVKNYLYYYTGNAVLNWSGHNANYDKAIHEGLESSLDLKIKSWLTLFGNYSFTNAFFDGGVFDKSQIPLVPAHKASSGFRFSLPKDLTINITGNYIGRRYFLNDQANAYSRLNGYVTADTNLSWRFKDLTVTCGINNLFNKKYSEYAGVKLSTGEKFYYPSPGRNFDLSINYSF